MIKNENAITVKNNLKLFKTISHLMNSDKLEYNSLSNEELFEVIKNELYVDEANSNNVFLHKKRAEYLERAMYVCPFCGLSEFESQGKIVACKKCGKNRF